MNHSILTQMDKFRTQNELAEFVTHEINISLNTESSLLFLYDTEANLLRLSAGTSQIEGIAEAKDNAGYTLPVDESTLPGWCALHNEALFFNKPEEIAGLGIPGYEASSAAVVSIRRYGKCIGVITAMNRPEGFTDETISELEKTAQELPPALSYIKMREDLDELEMRLSEMVTRITDGYTDEGNGHVNRVASLCSELSEIMDIPGNIRRKLWKGAIYHDVGKIQLQGRAPWEITRFHPTEGASYLKSVRVLKDIAPLVETSHERYDGTGFPSGLAGEQAPIEAWILALAEDLEEFSSKNRSDFFEDMILNFFRNHADSHHPLVIEALTVLVKSGTAEYILRGWK